MAPNPAPAADSRPPFRPRRPLVIGITGGIAAGKSAVAALFAARGLRLVDADAHAREVTADPEVLVQIRAAFGDLAVADGRLDRRVVADRVFADPAARSRLEAIVHPPIRARVLADLDAARAQGDSVVLDAPLLFETGLVDFCDHTVYVEADAATRRQRAAARGWARGELERREAAQLPAAVKKVRAAHIIENDGDLASAAREVAAVLDRIAAAG